MAAGSSVLAFFKRAVTMLAVLLLVVAFPELATALV